MTEIVSFRLEETVYRKLNQTRGEFTIGVAAKKLFEYLLSCQVPELCRILGTTPKEDDE